MNIAVITGATSGIGRACYKEIRKKYRWLDEIWCIGRNIKKLACLSQQENPRVRVFSLDLLKEEELAVFRQALAEHPGLQIKLLVNAAGTGKYGSFQKREIPELADTVRLNCEALTVMTRLCLPYMKKKSRILEIASGAAFFPQPDFAVYAASKAYVLSLSEALRLELKNRGITVTAVCPGPVDTPFLPKSREGVSVPSYKKTSPASPSAVAKKAILDASNGKALSLYGMPMRLLYFASQFLPGRLFAKITFYLNHRGDTHEKN